MMFEVVTSDNHVTPPFIFPHGLIFNTEAYIKSLDEVMLFWIERVAARSVFIWQQEFALCRTSRRTQSWLSENSPLKSGHLISQIAIPLIIIYEVLLSERPTKLRCLDTVIKANGDFFE